MHSLELFDGFFDAAKATAEVHEDSDKHMVFSLHDAHFKLQHFARYHSETVSDHGDVTTFAIVRYGTQEKRTASASDTLSPRWEGTFVFPFDPSVEFVVFLFFVEDKSRSGKRSSNSNDGGSRLFGHVIIPLHDEEGPLPPNWPYLHEIVPVVAAGNDQLSRLRMKSVGSEDMLSFSLPVSSSSFSLPVSSSSFSTAPAPLPPPEREEGGEGGGGEEEEDTQPTWPTVAEEVKEKWGGSAWQAGEATLAVALIEGATLCEALKVSAGVSYEKDAVAGTLDRTLESLQSLIATVGDVSGSAGERAAALETDRRRNPEYPVQLGELANEEVEKIAATFKTVTAHRAELLPALAHTEEKAKEFSSTIQELIDDLDTTTIKLGAAEEASTRTAGRCVGCSREETKD